MRTCPLLIAFFLYVQAVGAEQIELVIGKEVSATAYAKLKQLKMMGAGGDILNRRPDPSVFVNRTEYVSERSQFVVAIEVVRDPLRNEGKSLLSRVYFSNKGERASTKKDGEWKWIDAKKVVIDTKTWTASIQSGEQDAGGKRDVAPPDSLRSGTADPALPQL